MSSIIKTAVAKLGEKKIRGNQAHKQTIFDYAKDAGFDWVHDVETIWSSIFVNWVAQKNKFISTRKAKARSCYDVNTVSGFRRLSPSQILNLPEPTLKKGDQGDIIKALQNALKIAGFNCGISDGDYGPKTENAVKDLQSTSGFLKIDGKNGPNTKDYLQRVLIE